MSYKPSMFNHIYQTDNNELLLYNSYKGFESLASISAIDFNLIEKSLSHTNIENNQQFQKLKSLGYFVESNMDEILLCEQKYMDIVDHAHFQEEQRAYYQGMIDTIQIFEGLGILKKRNKVKELLMHTEK